MSILSGPTGGFGGWKDGPKRDYDDKHGRKDDHDWKWKDDKHDGKDGGKHGRKDDDHDWKSKDDKHDKYDKYDGKDGGKHGRKDDDHDWKSKDDKHDKYDKHDGKHGRKDDDHDWKSKDDWRDGKDGDKHARKDDCDSGNDNHQDNCEPIRCEPVCCDPEPDCDVHAALVGMSDIGSVVDFAIDSLSPGQGMDMGLFDMGGATDSLGA